jgi:hypothetical protein
MNGKRLGWSYASVAPLLVVVAACGATRFNEVGNVGGHGGDGDSGSGGNTNGGKNGLITAGTAGRGHGGSAGNVAGTSGDLPPGDGISGAAGERGAAEGLQCATCEVVSAAPDIRGVATGRERVFWIEYGSYDGLGNYQDDGRLMSQAFASGPPTVVAEGLQGPIEFEVSDDFAYVVVDHSSVAAGPIELARIPLDTGIVEVLQALQPNATEERVVNWIDDFFVAKGGLAFWAEHDVIYRLAEDETGPPTKFLDTAKLFNLAGDDSQLFLHDVEGFKSVPYAGGTPTVLREEYLEPGIPRYYGLSVVGDYMYGVESQDFETSYLSRMAKAGGTWKRLTEMQLKPGWVMPTQLVIEGGEYFDVRAREAQGGWDCSLREGSLSSDAPAKILAASSPCWEQNDEDRNYPWRAWDVAPTAVYLGWQDTLYRVPRTP